MFIVIGLLWHKFQAPARQSCSGRHLMLEQFYFIALFYFLNVFGICLVVLIKTKSPSPSSPTLHPFSLLNKLAEQLGQEHENLTHSPSCNLPLTGQSICVLPVLTREVLGLGFPGAWDKDGGSFIWVPASLSHTSDTKETVTLFLIPYLSWFYSE